MSTNPTVYSKFSPLDEYLLCQHWENWKFCFPNNLRKTILCRRMIVNCFFNSKIIIWFFPIFRGSENVFNFFPIKFHIFVLGLFYNITFYQFYDKIIQNVLKFDLYGKKLCYHFLVAEKQNTFCKKKNHPPTSFFYFLFFNMSCAAAKLEVRFLAFLVVYAFLNLYFLRIAIISSFFHDISPFMPVLLNLKIL